MQEFITTIKEQANQFIGNGNTQYGEIQQMIYNGSCAKKNDYDKSALETEFKKKEQNLKNFLQTINEVFEDNGLYSKQTQNAERLVILRNASDALRQIMGNVRLWCSLHKKMANNEKMKEEVKSNVLKGLQSNLKTHIFPLYEKCQEVYEDINNKSQELQNKGTTLPERLQELQGEFETIKRKPVYSCKEKKAKEEKEAAKDDKNKKDANKRKRKGQKKGESESKNTHLLSSGLIEEGSGKATQQTDVKNSTFCNIFYSLCESCFSCFSPVVDKEEKVLDTRRKKGKHKGGSNIMM